MFFDFLTQNFLWVLAFLVVANLLVYTTFNSTVKGVNAVSALQLPQLQRDESSIIIDVSDVAQYQKGHIPDAVNFPLNTINADNKALLNHKDKTVILVCPTGSNSNKAAKMLLELGFSNLNSLKGGLFSWTKENLPISTS